MKTIGLFAGIGGLELGFARAGHHPVMACEIDPLARAVLLHRFPNVEVRQDVRRLRQLPKADILLAGFPCQDLSQAGTTAGIMGERSGVVAEIFRLLHSAQPRPPIVILENVPFMLSLDRGKAMRWVIRALENLGYSWAYRVVDARSFGLPQRRPRVLIVAALHEDPRCILLADDARHVRNQDLAVPRPCGFYWTEGRRGLGWAIDAVPPLKGGSGLGIPSPPAIWFPADKRIATPEIGDVERLQGFAAGWTSALEEMEAGRSRWRLLGNAVSVPVAEWLGRRIASPGRYDGRHDPPLARMERWPSAGWGRRGRGYVSAVSAMPLEAEPAGLASFLKQPVRDLSARAASGFLRRALEGGLSMPEGFLGDVAYHARRMAGAAPA